MEVNKEAHWQRFRWAGSGPAGGAFPVVFPAEIGYRWIRVEASQVM